VALACARVDLWHFLATIYHWFMPLYPDDVRHLLEQSRTIAIVGLSPDEQRPSHDVARYLQAHGFRIVPVNPRCTEILGEQCYAQLEDIPFAVDLVNVFRRTEDVAPIARSAVAIGARGFWQQLGVKSSEADATARDGGLVSVMDRCIKIDHRRLLAGR
jgi:uncharacterized protein